jgi:hypothetical protein
MSFVSGAPSCLLFSANLLAEIASTSFREVRVARAVNQWFPRSDADVPDAIDLLFGRVHSRVFAACLQFEILDAIVCRIFVLVVDDLVEFETPTKLAFHHDSMFVSRFSRGNA